MSTQVDSPLQSRRFTILRELGAGGMGVVYEALDRELGATVALKTLRTAEAGLLIHFKNEFRALQDVHHPNLVSLGELFEENGRTFFTMELVRGSGLLEYVQSFEAHAPHAPHAPHTSHDSHASHTSRDSHDERTVPSGRPAAPIEACVASANPTSAPVALDEARLRSSLGQLALGLTALHEAGCVHRDVKPSNVLVTGSGRVVLLDFGLVTAHGERARSVMGTAHFMAPEQVTRDAVGPEADWYAFGALLFRALTGRNPFGELSSAAVMLVKQGRDPAAPGHLVPGLPADLESLCVDLLRRNPAERPTGAQVLRRLGVGTDHGSRTVPPPASRSFVGRLAELDKLEGALATVRSGHAAAVLIEGESGMGKSALVRRFLRDLPDGVTVLAGRCYQRESVPYKALDEVMLALARRLEDWPDAAALLPRDAFLLSSVFPALGMVPGAASDPAGPALVDPQERRARSFAAARELFVRVAAQGPLVVTIDDLQWADAESFALLAELTRGLSAPTMLLVATVRTGSISSETQSAIATSIPAEALGVIHLERLPAADARELAALLLDGVEKDAAGEASAPVDTAAIAAEAAGHPLFIEALVRHRLAAEGGTAPVRLEDALWACVQRLDAPARRLLELAAIAGGPVSHAIAAQAAASDLDEIGRWTAALRAGNLLQSAGSGREAKFEIHHDRIRETVVRRLDPASKRAWHGRLALALEATAEASAEALATHWAEAGDRMRAAGYAIAAADRAAETLAFDRAARLYRWALDLDSPNGAGARPLRVKLGDALANAGQGSAAAEAYLHAARDAGEVEALELVRRAAENLLRSGYVDEGTASLRDVLGAAGMQMPSTPAQALATLLYLRARVRLRGLTFRERPASTIDSKQLARIDVCWSAAIGFGMNDNLRGACFQAQNLLLSLEAGEPYRVARAIALEIPFASTPGGPARARVRELGAAAARAAERTGHPHLLGLLPAVRSSALFLEGRFREALGEGDRADAILRDRCTNVPWERSSVRTFAAWSLWFLGDLDELGRRLPAHLREAEERGDRYFATNLRSAFTNSAWLVPGNAAEARRLAEESIGAWSREGFHLQHFYDIVARTHVDLYLGEGERAYHALEGRWRALERSMTLRIQLVNVFMQHLRAHAALAAAAASPARAPRLRPVAEKAARRIERESMPWSDPLAAAIRAALAQQRGDLPEAARHLAAAIRGFDAAEMGLFAAAARRSLGQLLGGDAGREAIAAADGWMRARGVAEPARITAMLLGGLDAG